MSDIDPRWPRLLAAARAWQASVIPGTATGLAAETRVLREAIAEFDNCDHQRIAHVFYRDGSVRCSTCTALIKPPDPAPTADDNTVL